MGEARRRGTKEQRKAQAIAAGRIKISAIEREKMRVQSEVKIRKAVTRARTTRRIYYMLNVAKEVPK